MSELEAAVHEYLALRRKLGFKLRGAEGPLLAFVTWAEAQGASYITTELSLRWATGQVGVLPATRAARLGLVRGFAAFRKAADPRTEIPPDGILPHRYRRVAPHMYSAQEIAHLLERARQLPSARGLRGHTYTTLFGLLAVTGMRSSESVALDRADVDLDEGVLTIRKAKGGRSRLVPLHASTRGVLRAYAAHRARVFPTLTTSAFFVSERGTRVTEWSMRYTFAKVSREIGLRAPTQNYRHGHGPRLHDLRHAFAVRTLLNWYRAGLDVEREMPKLTTYLGHVHVNDTYWYLQAVPEFLEQATWRVTRPSQEAVQ